MTERRVICVTKMSLTETEYWNRLIVQRMMMTLRVEDIDMKVVQKLDNT